MEERPTRSWPVLVIASAASLPVITNRLIAGGGVQVPLQIFGIDHQIASYFAAAAVVAISWAWTTRVEAIESIPKNGSDDNVRSDGKAEMDASQHVLTYLQDAWWTYIGFPLHFRATRVVGFAKSLIQQSIFVAWESTRIAPKRLQWWLKRRGVDNAEGTAQSRTLTLQELSKIRSIPHNDDCVAAVVGNTGPCSKFVEETVPDSFLLHCGSLLGEQSAVAALQTIGRSGDLGTARGLFGKAEESGWADKPWKKPNIKSKPGLTFKLEKKYIRNGLFLYRTSAVIENADIKDFKCFNLSMQERQKWDWTLNEFYFVEDSPDVDPDCGSGVMFLESRMPGPMVNREYVYARRVWERSDGGCYSLCVSCTHPQTLTSKGRNVRVEEFTTAYVMRPAKSLQGRSTPAIELASIYYDAPKMKSMAYNLAMNSGMWTAVQTVEENYRKFSVAAKPKEGQVTGRAAQVTRRGKRRALLKNLGGIASGACKVAVLVAVAGMTKGRPK